MGRVRGISPGAVAPFPARDQDGFMNATCRKTHWETIYSTKAATGVSWYQSEPQLSLELIRSVAPPRGARIVDVGGGASLLVDRLLELPCSAIAVLDLSATALEITKNRLGDRAQHVRFIVADVALSPELGTFDLWHDRAVFHFLTHAHDRRSYANLVSKSLAPGGHAVISTFALDGPSRCSDLEVCRYNAQSLARELGQGFTLVTEAQETHTTPWGAAQPFLYAVFKRG